MKKIILHLICFSLLLCSVSLYADSKTFIREYTYDASEIDSKISCQAIALEQVKRLLLEELGTYLESVTVVKDYRLDKDQITTLTAGIVQTTILDEKWDGKQYWLKAKITADPDEVASSIDNLRHDQQLVRDMEEAREEASQALREVEALQEELAAVKTDKGKREEYNEAVKQLVAVDWFERGQALTLSGNYNEAVKAYDRVIVLRPNTAKVYSNRGAVYIHMGNYERAVKDLDKAVALNPRNRKSIYHRDIAYKKLKDPKQAKIPEKDILKRHDEKIQLGEKGKEEIVNHHKESRVKEKQQQTGRAPDRVLKEHDEQSRQDKERFEKKGREVKLKKKEQREQLKIKKETEEKKKKQQKIDQYKQRQEDEKKRKLND